MEVSDDMSTEREEPSGELGSDDYPFRYLISPISNLPKDQFLRSPVALEIALKASVFSEALMNKPVYNKNRGIIVVSTKQKVDCNLGEVKLGSWKVNCKQLENSLLTYGVIGPISEDEDLVALKEALVYAKYPVVNVERLFKRQAGINNPTQCIKIGFNIKQIPSKVYICDVAFSVRIYIPPARQCYKCQRFGHFSNSCTSKMRCLYCSQCHDIKSCPKIEKKCANCQGNHLANYGGCTVYKEAQTVQKISAETGKSYTAILSQFRSDTRPTPVSFARENNNTVNLSATNCVQDPVEPLSYARAVSNTSLSFNDKVRHGPQQSFVSVSCLQALETSLTNKLSQVTNTLNILLRTFDSLMKILIPIIEINSNISQSSDTIESFRQLMTECSSNIPSVNTTLTLSSNADIIPSNINLPITTALSETNHLLTFNAKSKIPKATISNQNITDQMSDGSKEFEECKSQKNNRAKSKKRSSSPIKLTNKYKKSTTT